MQKKACYKLSAFRRLRKFLTLAKTKILACLNIESQLTYCPLIWMFYSEIDMQRVEKIQYKNLVYNNYMVTYDKPLPMDNKLKIHPRHLKFLVTEILNSKNKLNPSFVLKTYKEKSSPY